MKLYKTINIILAFLFSLLFFTASLSGILYITALKAPYMSDMLKDYGIEQIYRDNLSAKLKQAFLNSGVDDNFIETVTPENFWLSFNQDFYALYNTESDITDDYIISIENKYIEGITDAVVKSAREQGYTDIEADDPAIISVVENVRRIYRENTGLPYTSVIPKVAPYISVAGKMMQTVFVFSALAALITFLLILSNSIRQHSAHPTKYIIVSLITNVLLSASAILFINIEKPISSFLSTYLGYSAITACFEKAVINALLINIIIAAVLTTVMSLVNMLCSSSRRKSAMLRRYKNPNLSNI
ncbi:MAG: hypothetical protein U0M08_04540 [Clostridia bacterium]|nr:hypothetical protein [Clostridia bacterium]